MQHLHLARHPPIGSPALGDQFRIRIRPGDAQSSQVHVKTGGIGTEGLNRGQGCCTTHAFRHGSEGFQGSTEPVVIEQHAGNAQDFM